MAVVILVGPGPLRSERAFGDAFAIYGEIRHVEARSRFRRYISHPGYAGIVLFDRDRTGKPTEPLLRYCVTRNPICPVVNVLTTANARITSLNAQAYSLLHHFPLVRGCDADYAALARYVMEITEPLRKPSRP